MKYVVLINFRIHENYVQDRKTISKRVPIDSNH